MYVCKHGAVQSTGSVKTREHWRWWKWSDGVAIVAQRAQITRMTNKFRRFLYHVYGPQNFYVHIRFVISLSTIWTSTWRKLGDKHNTCLSAFLPVGLAFAVPLRSLTDLNGKTVRLLRMQFRESAGIAIDMNRTNTVALEDCKTSEPLQLFEFHCRHIYLAGVGREFLFQQLRFLKVFSRTRVLQGLSFFKLCHDDELCCWLVRL